MTSLQIIRSPQGSRTGLVCALVMMAAVAWFFHWTVKTSGGFNPPGEEDYYNFLVRGWRAGHLHLSKEPKPELIALTEPYDPAQNDALRMGDASYYKGHYYLYFSGAPALVAHLPYWLITGKELGTTTAIFVFCLTGYLVGCATWLAIQRRYFPESAWWFSPLVVTILGVGTHVLILQRRPLVWECPLSAGYAFSMLTFGAVYLALHGRRPLAWLTVAGIFFGLAVASRPTCVFAAILFVPVLWLLGRERRETFWWKGWAVVAGPVGLFVVALLVHNYARFDHPLEFGITYQLSSQNEAKETHFSPRYAVHNAAIYLFNPVEWERAFPFVKAVARHGAPRGYLDRWVEPIAGLAVSLPFCFGVFLLPLAWQSGAAQISDGERLRVMIVSMGLFVLTVGAFYLTFYCATPRYMTDFTPTVMMLSGIGGLALEQRVAQRKGLRLVRALVLGTGLATIAMGLLLNFDYHQRSLKAFQPELWARLERVFNVER
jgi:hypothetical protein